MAKTGHPTGGEQTLILAASTPMRTVDPGAMSSACQHRARADSGWGHMYKQTSTTQKARFPPQLIQSQSLDESSKLRTSEAQTQTPGSLSETQMAVSTDLYGVAQSGELSQTQMANLQSPAGSQSHISPESSHELSDTRMPVSSEVTDVGRLSDTYMALSESSDRLERIMTSSEALAVTDCEQNPGVQQSGAGFHRTLAHADQSEQLLVDAPQDGPARIGAYAILSVLGSGAMGIVFSAYDERLDRRVALKLVKGSPKTSSNARLRMIREAQAMARLSHPNVAHVYEVGDHRGQVFVAMEFVRGMSLRQWEEQAQHARDEIIDVYTQAARGLGAAHAAGIVHRDFKPDNVLVGDDGRVRVVDFGLAHAHGQADHEDPAAQQPLTTNSSEAAFSVKLTRAGSLVGTVAYMAPEQFLHKPTTPKSDQFSLCVALYAALYGERPFAGNTLMTVMSSVLAGRVNAPPGDTHVPAWLRQVLLRGLSVKPDDRFATMEDLCAALHPHRRARRRWIVALACIPLLVAAGLVLWQNQQRPCKNAHIPISEVWGNSIQRSLATKFEQSALAFADSSWTTVERELDQFSQRWQTQAHDVCLAKTQAQSSELQQTIARQQLCLSERLDQLSALLDFLRRDDPAAIVHAVEGLDQLADPGQCALSQIANLPVAPQPEQREAVRALDDAIARLHLEVIFGKRQGLSSQALELVRRSKELEYAPTYGLALLLQARVERLENHVELATAAAQTSLEVAEQHGLDTLAVRALIERARLTSAQPQQFETAFALLELATYKLARANLSGSWMESAIHELRGQILSKQGRHAEALEQHTRALELRTAEQASNRVRVASSHNNLANVYTRTGEHERALAHAHTAREIGEQTYGASHPLVAATLHSIGDIETERKEIVRAQEIFDRVTATYREIYADDDPKFGNLHRSLGYLAFIRGDHPTAVSEFTKAIASVQLHATPLSPSDVLAIYYSLAAAQASGGNYVEALATLEEASRQLQSAPPLHRAHLEVAERQAAFALKAHQHTRVIDITDRALAQITLSDATPATLHASLLRSRGRAYDKLQQYEEAVQVLDAALEVTSAPGMEMEQARVRWLLASSLRKRNPKSPRVRELSLQALAFFETREDRFSQRYATMIRDYLRK